MTIRLRRCLFLLAAMAGVGVVGLPSQAQAGMKLRISETGFPTLTFDSLGGTIIGPTWVVLASPGSITFTGTYGTFNLHLGATGLSKPVFPNTVKAQMDLDTAN